MSVTEDQIKEAAVWTWTQVRRALLIHCFLAILAVLFAAFGAYWYASYQDIGARMQESLAPFKQSRTLWIEEALQDLTQANVNMSVDPRLPSIDAMREMQENVSNVILSLDSVPTPTKPIEVAAAEFKQRLNDVVREIGRYDGTPERLTRVVAASNVASQAGAAHNQEIEDFLGSTIRRVFGSL